MTKIDYETLVIKEFNFWKLYLSPEQNPYVGRCYAAAKEGEGRGYESMTREERDEFFDVIAPKWEDAVRSLYGLNKPNLAFLGNAWDWLHGHLIPRRNKPVMVHGFEFVDRVPKGIMLPYDNVEFPLEFLLRIRDEMKSALG